MQFFKFPPQITGLLASRHGTSWQFATIFVVIYLGLDALGALAEPITSVYDFPLLSFFSAACTWIVVTAGGLLIWRRETPRFAAAKQVLTWFFAAAISIVGSRFAVWLVTAQPLAVLSVEQAITYLVSGFVNLASYAIVISAVANFREISGKLRSESVRLAGLRVQLAEHIAGLKVSYSQEVQQRIAPVVHEIQAAVAGLNAEAIMQQAKTAIESVVLPLSQELGLKSIDKLVAQLKPQAKQPLADRLRLFASTKFDISQNFSPLFTAIIFCASILPAFSYFYADRGLFAGLLVLAVVLVGQVIASVVFSNRSVSLWLALAVIFASSSVIAIVAAQSIKLVVSHSSSEIDTFLAFGTWLVVFLISFAQLINLASLGFLNQLAETQHALAVSLQKGDAQVLQLQRRISSVIHADIQGKLRAVLLRVKNSALDEVNLAELSADLQHISKVVNSIAEDPVVNFSSDLAGLIEFWRGVCEVIADVEAEANLALEGDPGLAQGAIDVITEGLANAIKHGGAKQASVLVRLEPQAVQIVVSNSAGSNDSETPLSTGQGSQLLDRLSSQWQLDRRETSTILRVSLPR